MYELRKIVVGVVLMSSLLQASDTYLPEKQILPDLKMKKSGLSFKLIEGYQNYKIVASHYRTDKNEIRYILANPIAYNALQKGTFPLPDGSKVVKIGWSVKKMALFPSALEADSIQRVEYMYKDASRFNVNGDHWGYARFIKKGDKYVSWEGDTNSCIACHSPASSNDYLFTKMQQTFK